MRLHLRGIDADSASTLFKILHNILPTKERVDRLSQREGPLKGICTYCPGVVDNIFHALTQCKRSRPAADYMLKIIRSIDKNTTMFDAIYLQGDTWGQNDLPISWVTAHSLHLIWTKQQSGGILPIRLHAELSALNNILCKTPFKEESLIISRALTVA